MSDCEMAQLKVELPKSTVDRLNAFTETRPQSPFGNQVSSIINTGLDSITGDVWTLIEDGTYIPPKTHLMVCLRRPQDGELFRAFGIYYPAGTLDAADDYPNEDHINHDGTINRAAWYEVAYERDDILPFDWPIVAYARPYKPPHGAGQQ